MENIAKLCRKENIQYEAMHYTAFELMSQQANIPNLDVKKYSFPLPDEKRFALIQRDSNYKRPERMEAFYTNTVKGVSRDFSVSKMLEEKSVPSIVRYLGNAQRKDPDGVTEIFLITEKLTPLNLMGLGSNITIGFVVDMGRRLFAICKDLEKQGIVHRNITPYSIFYNDQNRMFLGGFESAYVSNADKRPETTPLYPCHVAPDVAAGKTGSMVSDMYSIASIMGCFFHGEDICKTFSGNISRRLPVLIQDALLYGLSMEPENVPKFRKTLNNIYKDAQVNKYWDVPISFFYRMRLGDGSDNVQETAENTASTAGPDRLGKAISFLCGVAAMSAIVLFAISSYGLLP